MTVNVIYLIADDIREAVKGKVFAEKEDLDFQPIWNLQPQYKTVEDELTSGYVKFLDLYLITRKTPTTRLEFMFVKAPNGNKGAGWLSNMVNSGHPALLPLVQPETYSADCEQFPGLTEEQSDVLRTFFKEIPRQMSYSPYYDPSGIVLFTVSPYYRYPDMTAVRYMVSGADENHLILVPSERVRNTPTHFNRNKQGTLNMLDNTMYLIARDIVNLIKDKEFVEKKDLDFRPNCNIEPVYKTVDYDLTGGYIEFLDLYIMTRSLDGVLEFMFVKAPNGFKISSALSHMVSAFLTVHDLKVNKAN